MIDPDLTMFVFAATLAYVYAFVSGMTDAANAIATAVGTRVLSPMQAIGMAAVFEVLGALSGTAVALTIGAGIVETGVLTQSAVAAALLGAMTWSLFTYFFGIPVSETHGLIGGIVGVGLYSGGVDAVQWWSLFPVLAAIVVSPILGGVGGAGLLTAVYRVFSGVSMHTGTVLFGNLQRLSAAFMAFSHGRNDAQKPMGILALALAVYLDWDEPRVPIWVIVSVATVAAAGVGIGGWRIIHTLGSRITSLRPVQGFAAETAAASVLELASSLAIPVSTTHTITSSIIGVATVHGYRRVRWAVVSEIVQSWVLTLPVTIALGFGFAAFLHALLG